VAFGLEAGIDLNHDLTCRAARKEVERSGLSFDSNDIVVLCAPVYAGRLPSCFSCLFSSIHANGARAVLSVTYGNRAYDDALIELEDLCCGAGFVPLCAGAFVGMHSYDRRIGADRPDAKDLDAMHALGRIALEKIEEQASIAEKIPGNRPYRQGIVPSVPPYGPIVSGFCTRCGICATVCPVDAIPATGPYITDPAACIHCCACIRACPEGARSMEDLRHQVIVKRLEQGCLDVRREPELFS
jgi:ferredoxin